MRTKESHAAYMREYSKEYHKTPTFKAIQKRYAMKPSTRRKEYLGHIRRKYGITAEQFDTLVEFQAGLCAICCAPMSPFGDTCVEHNHDTLEIRGLTHVKCNAAIGALQDNPLIVEHAAAYLRAH